MATVNLSNGLEGQDYTADEVREANDDFAEEVVEKWGAITQAMGEEAREAVHNSLDHDPTSLEFLALYLEHPAATNVVID